MRKEIISIFSGIDCLGLGFENNFDIILAVEKEKKACATLNANKDKFHPKMNVINKDISEITDDEILKYKDTFGIIGGPPCQPFSTARGEFDPNHKDIKYLWVYVNWIKIIHPIFFVFENVKGFLQKDKLPIFEYFIEQLELLDYDINYKILNSYDYGNVQKRERLIVVGFKKELNVEYEFPKPLGIKKLVKDILVEDEEIGPCAEYEPKRMEIVPHIPEGGNWRSLKDEELKKKALLGNYTKREGGMTGVYRRLDRNSHCLTLTTSPKQRNTMRIHPTEDRPLSVKEYKRAFGVPEDYKLVASTCQSYKYLGNGVPVEMATCISQSVYDALEKKNIIKKFNWRLQ